VADSPQPLHEIGPQRLREGSQLTLVGASFTTQQCVDAARSLAAHGVECDVIDLRVLNPLDCGLVARSVEKTGRLLVVDGGWSTCGLAGEVIAQVAERVDPSAWKAKPRRLTLPDAPAPSAGNLEAAYYPQTADVERLALACVHGESQP
jgi:pyruvate/2-oxoglutarate/acetoin dehydrogenase E1 component